MLRRHIYSRKLLIKLHHANPYALNDFWVQSARVEANTTDYATLVPRYHRGTSISKQTYRQWL